MRGHLPDSRRGRRSQHVVGVRDLKANAARIVREVRDLHASYILTHRGHAVGQILPFDPIGNHSQVTDDSSAGAAWATFMRAGRRLERRFRPGVGGVRLLSAMRR